MNNANNGIVPFLTLKALIENEISRPDSGWTPTSTGFWVAFVGRIGDKCQWNIEEPGVEVIPAIYASGMENAWIMCDKRLTWLHFTPDGLRVGLPVVFASGTGNKSLTYGRDGAYRSYFESIREFSSEFKL